MKKILALLLAALLTVCMIACSKDDQGTNDKGNDSDANAEDNATAYGDFLYDVNEDGNYKITGYTYTGIEKRAVVIPSTIADRPVTAIGESAFKSLHNISAVTIPDSVRTIGAFAFYDCDFLTAITIPSSVTHIGECAFDNCSALATVTLNRGLLELGYGVFRECTALTSIVLPQGLLTVGGGAFLGCTVLTSATIPNTVIELGDAAFYGCNATLTLTYENDTITAMNDALAAYASVEGNTAPTTFAQIVEILQAANVDTEGLAENGGYKYTWNRTSGLIEKTDAGILTKMNAALEEYKTEHDGDAVQTWKDAQAVLANAGYYVGGVTGNGAKYVWDANENVLYGAQNAEDMTLLVKINAALKANPPTASVDTSAVISSIESIVKNAELELSALNVSVSSGKFFWDAEDATVTDRYIGEALQKAV